MCLRVLSRCSARRAAPAFAGLRAAAALAPLPAKGALLFGGRVPVCDGSTTFEEDLTNDVSGALRWLNAHVACEISPKA